MAVRKRQKAGQTKQASNVFEHLNLELKEIKPLTHNQELAFSGFENDNCMLLLGKQGTGKSFIAIYKALLDVVQGRSNKVIIIRSPVASANIGFLPGTEEQKAEVYFAPYIDIINNLFGRGDAWAILTKHDLIECKLTAFIRGLTIDNATIVFDEIQNATLNEAITIVTRAGKNTKIHFCGDIAQCDITKKHERVINKFLAILNIMPEFRSVYFTIDDVVRSGLVKSFLLAQHKLYKDEVII